MKDCLNKALLLSFLNLFVMAQSMGAESTAANFSGKIIFPEGYPEKQNAVVYVDNLDKTFSVNRKTTVVINQKDMQFVPFLTVATVGSTVVFKNLDPHLHTVKSETGPLKSMKLAMTPVKHQYERTLKLPGISELLCDIHSQMRAFVVVVPNSFYAVTDDAGSFTFSEPLPPPPYDLKVWHDVLPGMTISIRSQNDLKVAKEIVLKTWEQASR